MCAQGSHEHTSLRAYRDFGHHAVKDVVTHHDFHATVLHLFGLDSKKLVYARNGQELSLVDNKPCRVVQEIIG